MTKLLSDKKLRNEVAQLLESWKEHINLEIKIGNHRDAVVGQTYVRELESLFEHSERKNDHIILK